MTRREIKELKVFTPVFNAASLITSTIESIAANRAHLDPAVAIRYVILDGGSTDETLAICRRWAAGCTADNFAVDIISEPDNGLYDALANGLGSFPSGDIFCYINAGDYYSPYALAIAAGAIGAGYQWITGRKVFYNEAGVLIRARLPFTYRRPLIQSGLYGPFLRFIQQESTFWHASLNQHLDLDQLRTYRLAGDYYLWKTFADYADLTIIDGWLGGFRIHRHQLSENKALYTQEMRTMCARPTVGNYLMATRDLMFDLLPEEIRRKLMDSETLRDPLDFLPG